MAKVGLCHMLLRLRNVGFARIPAITVQFTYTPKRSFRFFAANDHDGWFPDYPPLGGGTGKVAVHVASLPRPQIGRSNVPPQD